MISPTDEESSSYEKRKVCYVCRKVFSSNDDNEVGLNEKYQKVKDHCHYTGKTGGAAHDVCNLRYKTPKEIAAVFHNQTASKTI